MTESTDIKIYNGYANSYAHITPQERDNLLKLADGLEKMPPPDVRFNMDTYCERTFAHFGPTCGAVGCAIGVASYIVEPRLELNEHWAALPGRPVFEHWEDFAIRLFGFSNHKHGIGVWCFSDAWAETDNTPEGAAKRIRWALTLGVPDDYIQQMYGSVPLCYN